MKHSEQLAEQHIERERMQDVLLLVEHLVASQETTFKLIIDCLYDVGSVSFINQKVKLRSVNRLTKMTASMSKPMFRLAAFYWVKKNCPRLVTNWLYKKVTAGQRNLSQLDYSREVVGQALEQYEQSQMAAAATERTLEIQRLQGRVKMLQGMLFGTVLALGGATVWIIYDIRPELSRSQTPLESVQLEGCDRASSSTCTHQ